MVSTLVAMTTQTATAPKRRNGAPRRRKPLAPVPTIERAEVKLHGHRVNFNIAGQGPPVVLIHGIAGRAAQWDQAMLQLAERHTVIAPDLLGHGESAKPRGDYSLGAFASGVRDLLIGLDIEGATVVGHSLGGGIAMQFAYQFPERCQRLVLVSSGGLGQDVHPVLRAATLPGSELVLPLLAHEKLLEVASIVPRVLGKVGFRAGPDITEMARGYSSLSNAEGRSAFIHTVRAVIDPTGQRINASDRLYLASKMPTMIVWGHRDRIIPVAHARPAHKGMPGSRLELFEDAGHFPHLDDPLRFSRCLLSFLADTTPAKLDTEEMRELVLDRDPQTAKVLKRLQREHATG
jgi:pimeloyl-ACP methyl ester carboxylesterase